MTRVIRASLAPLLLLLLVVVQLWAHDYLSRIYTYYPFASGWWLVGLSVTLYLYTVRKKVVFMPFGSVSSWLSVHLYGGLLSAAAVLAHMNFRMPEGPLELALFSTFGLILLTGIVAWILGRIVPVLLTARDGEYVFETIPSEIARLRHEMSAMVLDSVARTNSVALAKLYAEVLEAELAGPRHQLAHLAGSQRPWFELEQVINSRARYFDGGELRLLDELRLRLEEKYNLDYHYAWQGLLRLVMRLHIPLTLILLLLVMTHVLVIYNFIGWHR